MKVLHRRGHEGIEGKKRYRYTPFFILDARWGLTVNTMYRSLYPRGKRPVTHSTGICVGRRAGLDECGIFRLHRDSIPGPSSP